MLIFYFFKNDNITDIKKPDGICLPTFAEPTLAYFR